MRSRSGLSFICRRRDPQRFAAASLKLDLGAELLEVLRVIRSDSLRPH
jgi:hypothetical protein